MPRQTSQVVIGTSGYQYNYWKGILYLEGLPRKMRSVLFLLPPHWKANSERLDEFLNKYLPAHNTNNVITRS